MVAGSSKDRKTWLIINLGVSLATGTSWLGFPCQKSKVLYLNLEVPRPFFAKRLKTILEAKAETKLEPHNFRVAHLRGIDLSEPALWNQLIKRAEMERPGVIIIDPQYKLYGYKEENVTSDMAKLLEKIDRLVEATGAASILVHHFSKGNKAGVDAQDRFSGNSVLIRDPDVYMSFTKHKEQDASTVDFIVRNVRTIDPFVIRWEYSIWVRDDKADPARLYVRKVGIAKKDAECLLQIIGSELITRKTVFVLAKEKLKLGRDKTREFLDHLEVKQIVWRQEIKRKGVRAEIGYSTTPPNTV